MHGFSGVEDCVAVHGDSIDVLKTGTETERAKRSDAARLKELANDAVGLYEGAFEEGNAKGCDARWKSCGGKSVRESGACYACADDDDIV
jgi:hypothetical protein